jgi:3-dehydroquinate dehydratase-2
LINRIHIVNGPNLNLLGVREKHLYGSLSFDEYLETIREGYLMVQLDYYQSNHEGDLIDYLHEHGFENYTGIILNAGGLTHTSISLRDAVAAITAPVIEVHITDIYQREPFRRISYLEEVCTSSIVGKGMDGYRMAIDALLSSSKK